MAKLPANQWAEVLKAVPPPAGAQTAPKVFVTEKPVELITTANLSRLRLRAHRCNTSSIPTGIFSKTRPITICSTGKPGSQQRVHQIYPTMTFTIGLERMIASLEKTNAHVQIIPVSPDLPTILVSTVPAIALMVNGKPVQAPIEGTSLQYVVNTNWDLF
jgi:hypothetical protein